MYKRQDPTFTSYWTETFDRCSRGEIDTWDYQWTFACWSHNGLTCLPARNLVTNIGFGLNATHTKSTNDTSALMPAEELEFPLCHPPIVVRNVEADSFTHLHYFGIKPNLSSQGHEATTRELIKRLPLARTLLAQARQLRRIIASNAS